MDANLGDKKHPEVGVYFVDIFSTRTYTVVFGFF